MNVSPSDVKAAVEALSFVFAECAKNNINELDFMDTLLVLTFPKEINEGLTNVKKKKNKKKRQQTCKQFNSKCLLFRCMKNIRKKLDQF